MFATQKMMLLGAIGVGKSSLVHRLVSGRFETDYKATIGVNILTHNLTLPRPNMADAPVTVGLSIWDLDGDLGENIGQSIYSRGASSALIIGDMTRQATQETMILVAKAFQDHLPGRPISFILNKADLISDADAIPIPNALITPQIPVLKTSAKTGFNVESAFQKLAQLTIERGL